MANIKFGEVICVKNKLSSELQALRHFNYSSIWSTPCKYLTQYDRKLD